MGTRTRYDREECARANVGWSAVLKVTPCAGYYGTLELWREGESTPRLSVELDRRLAAPMLVLVRAYEDDSRAGKRDAAQWGFLTKAQISWRKQRFDRSKIEPDTVKVYVGNIRAAVRKEWNRLGLDGVPPQPIETHKAYGYRIALTIVKREEGPGDGEA